MQEFKRCLKLRCSREPELTAAHCYMYDLALLRCGRLYPAEAQHASPHKSTPAFNNGGNTCTVVKEKDLGLQSSEVRCPNWCAVKIHTVSVRSSQCRDGQKH